MQSAYQAVDMYDAFAELESSDWHFMEDDGIDHAKMHDIGVYLLNLSRITTEQVQEMLDTINEETEQAADDKAFDLMNNLIGAHAFEEDVDGKCPQ